MKQNKERSKKEKCKIKAYFCVAIFEAIYFLWGMRLLYINDQYNLIFDIAILIIALAFGIIIWKQSNEIVKICQEQINHEATIMVNKIIDLMYNSMTELKVNKSLKLLVVWQLLAMIIFYYVEVIH